MAWIFLAVLAHIANGAVFIVDKSLLGGKSVLRAPLTYALYSAALAGLAIVLLPFASFVGSSFVLWWSFVAGAVHIFALFVFFHAMQKGEPSRIVPITGSSVPLFTVLFAVLFLGEAFTLLQGVGIFLLILGGALLSLRLTSPSPLRQLADVRRGRSEALLPLFAGLLFAIYFVITKYIYAGAPNEFLSVFMTTRVAEAAIALCGIAMFIGLPAFGQGKRKKKQEYTAQVLFAGNKLLAAGAFLLQTYAISLGSVSVVNALQGVQFAFVFIISLLFSRFFPKLFKEDITSAALLQKGIGIILVSIGITLIV